MHKRLRKYIAHLFLFIGIYTIAQQYPVKLNPVLMPPYSVRLADYATSSEEKVRLQVLLADLMQPSHKVNLRFSLESASSSTPIAATNPMFNGMQPFTIYPGTPLVLSNLDFRALFELQNLTGINAAQYSRPLPQGMYNFCFTAYDAVNNAQLSQKSCFPIYLQNYEPPFLTLPGNGEKVVKQNEFQNIVFQWMPRQEAPNTHYVFTLKEIWDTSINPSSAFLASRTLWQEKTPSKSFYYGIDKTALLEGKRYAWQVQAVSANQSTNGNIDPNDYSGVYQNNGLSEIFYFDYVRDCVAPIMLMAKNAGRGREEIRWMMPNGQPQGLYNVQYRLRGSTADWAEQKSYQESTFLTGLADHTEYEYRVGSVCGEIQDYGNTTTNQNAYTYSQIQYFTTNSDDKDPTYQCGVMPPVDVTNKTPLTGALSPNQTFTAGDFTVTVIKSTGYEGNYSGEGFIVVPYLGDTQIKVVFNNIQVNSEKKLINGIVETTYDVKESAVSYASTGLGELFGDAGIAYKDVKYKVKSIEYVSTPPPGRIIIISGGSTKGGIGSGGKEELPSGKDYEIVDEDGNIWYVDEKGNVTKGGKVAEGGVSTSQNTEGVSGSGKGATVTAYSAKGVTITWDASDSKFAYDDADKADVKLKSEYPKVKDANGTNTYVSYKAVINKANDTFDAKINITDTNLVDCKIIFKTLESGKAIQSEIKSGNETSANRTYRLNLEGAFSYATEQVVAVLMPKDTIQKQQIIGSFNLVHLEPKKVDVSLVPLDQSSVQNLDVQANQLESIYNKIGVSFNVKKEGVLDISSIASGDTIETPDDKAMSTYSQMQTGINSLYKGTDARYVLFVTNKKSSTGQNGYMRLNGQFGYIYNNAPSKTGAHELGHGIFKLEHPWSKYNTTQGATDLLMDYGSGTVLNHLDWKQINDPALKLYAFQSQSEGEFTDIQLTPDWEPFKFTGSSIYVSGEVKSPNGAVHGIAMCKNNDCSEVTYYYWKTVNNIKGYYTEGNNKPLDIHILTEEEKKKNPPITLYWDVGKCGYNENYKTNWNFIKNEKGTDLKDIVTPNAVVFDKLVPCISGAGSSVVSDEICKGKDLTKINAGYNKLINVLNIQDESIVVETINEVDICSIRALSYEDIIKLFNKLAENTNIGNSKELSIVRLVSSIKSEYYKDFFSILQKDNNKVLLNLMRKLDDKTFLIGDNNYTNFVKLLVEMFNDVNKKIIVEGINIDEVKSFTVVQNSYIIPSNNEKIFHIHFLTYRPELRISQGVWEITYECHLNENNDNECQYFQKIKYDDNIFSKPFDMVLLASDSDFNLLTGLTGGEDKKLVVVPTILLFYAHEKGNVENLKLYAQNTLDVVTLLVPVTKIAAGPKWLAKTFTFVDKWGKGNAAVNLAVNNSSLNKIPELKSALDTYNAVTAAMNITTLSAGIGRGVIGRFLKEVDNPSVKNILLLEAKNGNDDAKKILDVEAELKAYSEVKESKGWYKNLDEGWQWTSVSDYRTSLQSNYTNVFNKVNKWSDNELKIFMESFPTENSIKILNNEDALIDVWKKWNNKGINSIDDLRAFSRVWNKTIRGISFDDFYQKTAFQINNAKDKKFAPELFEAWSKGKGNEKALQDIYIKYGLDPKVEYPPCEGIWGIIARRKPNSKEIFDRFQVRENMGGGYAGVIENPDIASTISSRALKENYSEILKDGSPYYYFKFKLKNVPDDLVFEYGEAIPWFGELGGAIQIKSSKGLHELSNHIDLIEKWSLNAGKWEKVINNDLIKNGKFVDDLLEQDYQKYISRKAAQAKPPRERIDWKEARDYWLNDSPLARGNAFNDKARQWYNVNELNLENGKRLDSYVEPKNGKHGEIISRKATNLEEIELSTFEKYLQEMKNKYSAGTKIRSNKYPDLDGDLLQGNQILEIPESNQSFNKIQDYIDLANSKYNIEIRFRPE